MPDFDSRASVTLHPSSGAWPVTFGPFRFERTDRLLSRDGQEIHLPPRVLAILECLIERPGRVVTKQALLDAAWPDAAVSEGSLSEAIGLLRQALGDAPSAPAFVQTVHRRGYRFIAPVVSEAPPVPPAPLPLALVPPAQPQRSPVAGSEVQTSPRPDALPPLSTPVRRRYVAVGAFIIGLALLVAGLAAGALMRPSPGPVVARTTITLPPDRAPAPGLTAHAVAALSPDGTRVVYVAGSSGAYQLFERAIDQFEATPLPGTSGAHGAFFSPDGLSIGYFADQWLHTMSLASHVSVRLAEAGRGYGGSWHADGFIVVATGGPKGLIRVGLQDAEVTPIAVHGASAADLRFPQVLPDGKTIIATEWRVNQRDSVSVAIDIASGSVREIASGVSARWIAPGWLVFLEDDGLKVRPFPAEGPAVPVVSGVMSGVTGAGQFAMSAAGDLLYVPDEPERGRRELVRLGGGRVERLAFEPRAYQSASASPDGRFVATTIYERGASDLWIGEIARGTLMRVTSDGASLDPHWSADGRWVGFSWLRRGGIHAYRVSPDSPATPERLLDAGLGGATSVTSQSPDGTLLLQRRHPTRGIDLAIVRPPAADVIDWLATPASEMLARFSPDGRWVVFQSNRSGRNEIYLRSFADASFGERQVSPSGGQDPSWTPDGRAIMYLWNGAVFRVPAAAGVLQPAQKFGADSDLVLARAAGPVSAVGIRRLGEQRPITTLRLVTGWRTEVRQRLAR